MKQLHTDQNRNIFSLHKNPLTQFFYTMFFQIGFIDDVFYGFLIDYSNEEYCGVSNLISVNFLKIVQKKNQENEKESNPKNPNQIRNNEPKSEIKCNFQLILIGIYRGYHVSILQHSSATKIGISSCKSVSLEESAT